MAEYEIMYRAVVRRAAAANDAANLPVAVDAAVLDRYRGGGYALLRTNTVGRVRKEGGWALDFGIAPDEATIQACFGDLARLPEEERDHWAAYATFLPASGTFLQMRLAPGSCIDDGEIRSW